MIADCPQEQLVSQAISDSQQEQVAAEVTSETALGPSNATEVLNNTDEVPADVPDVPVQKPEDESKE